MRDGAGNRYFPRASRFLDSQGWLLRFRAWMKREPGHTQRPRAPRRDLPLPTTLVSGQQPGRPTSAVLPEAVAVVFGLLHEIDTATAGTVAVSVQP